MIENLPLEYLKLVHDTRLFIQNKRGFKKSDREAPPLPRLKESNHSTIPKKIERRQEETPPPQPIAPEAPKTPIKKNAAPEKKELKQGQWELHPMGQPEPDTHFRQKLSRYISVCDPTILIFLILEEEDALYRLFLENVSRAITKTFGPASVLLYHDALFQDPQKKLFLIPYSLIKKRFPQASIHHPFKVEHHTVLPLDTLDSYGSDPNQKRALWNAIQLLFQS